MESVLTMMDLEFIGAGKHKISAEKLFEISNVLFLDVRDSNEVKSLGFNLELFGIQTLNIPIDKLPEQVDELPKDKLIACFCSSGTRSAWAYIYLLSKGYQAKWLEASNEDLA